MSKLRELKEKRSTVVANIQKMQEQYDGKTMDAEARAAWDKMVAEERELKSQIESEERRLALDGMVAEQRENDHRSEDQRRLETRAFVKFLLGEELTAEEKSVQKRALNGTQGSVLVPSAVAPYIETAMLGVSGFMQAADIIRTAGAGELPWPTMNNTAAKAKVMAQYEQGTKAAKNFASKTLKAYTYRTDIIPVSLELLQDSAFNLEQYIGQLLATELVGGLNADFTNGAGTTAPRGIVKDAKAVSAAGAGVGYDDIIAVMKAVPSAYQANAKFMMNAKTMYDLALIKDGSERPIWTPAMSAAMPANIFGKEIVLNDDLADNAIVYGDLKKYKIRMVKEYSVAVLREALMEYLSIGILGYCRADGVLLDAGTNPVAILNPGA